MTPRALAWFLSLAITLAGALTIRALVHLVIGW